MGKACFQHNMAYGGFEDLSRRTGLTNYYMIKHLILLNIQNIIGIKEVSATRADKFVVGAIENEIVSKGKLAKELHRPIIRNFAKRKKYVRLLKAIHGMLI